MHVKNLIKRNPKVTTFGLAFSLLASTVPAMAQNMGAVPGYVPPLTMTTAPDYADDTRGVFVPAHDQHRFKSDSELYGEQLAQAEYGEPFSNSVSSGEAGDVYEKELNRISNGYAGYESMPSNVQPVPAPDMQVAQMQPMPQMPVQQQAPQMQAQPYTNGYAGSMPQHQPRAAQPFQDTAGYQMPVPDGGVEIAVGSVTRRSIDMNNSLVRLREDRVSVRRVLQRMMDQIGGGDWTIVWDLAEQNATLPEMEISIHAEEPFAKVMNALLARVQTRSGQPLRVIRYDNTQRLVITDRAGGHRLSGKVSPVGVDGASRAAVTENVLKEAMVSLHHDEIPLVDALENIVNQAGKGEWRLRVYAGLDQVLKPAHIEEPFNVAMERLLKLFNLKYEVFPGGKLIVVTHNNRLGYPGMQ